MGDEDSYEYGHTRRKWLKEARRIKIKQESEQEKERETRDSTLAQYYYAMRDIDLLIKHLFLEELDS